MALQPNEVRLSNVRLSFPKVFTPAKNVSDDGYTSVKYEATFILTPDHADVAKVRQAMQHVAKAKWGSEAAQVYKALSAQDRLALHDGDIKAKYAGFAGNIYVKASNSLKPTVVDRGRNPITEDSGVIYSGAYVNAIVSFRAFDHSKYGRRIVADLGGIQFFADGERLAGGSVSKADDFEEIPTQDKDAKSEFDGNDDFLG